MAQIRRNYRGKDVDMLVTVSTIIENAIHHKKFLQQKRTTWADPFFDDIKNRIETTTQTYLGVDSAKELRSATQAVYSIKKAALNSLSELKVQIIQDFKKDKIRRDELLNQLGFKAHHTKAQENDQEALIDLLFQFKTNMTASVKNEIIAKGTAEETIDEIVSYADSLLGANVNQETFKGQRKEITATVVKEFNEIHADVISISNIAARFFKDNPAAKEQFSFRKVSKTLNYSPNNSILNKN